jgi:REP element-mobilizing transposase RayT
MTKATTSTTRNNAVFDLTYHLVLVTKYRRKALSVQMLIRFGEIAAETLAASSPPPRTPGARSVAAGE